MKLTSQKVDSWLSEMQKMTVKFLDLKQLFLYENCDGEAGNKCVQIYFSLDR